MRPGPAPKHPSQRVRRGGTPHTARRSLPAAGYAGPIPQWPAYLNEPTERELSRYRELWACPLGAAWAGHAQEYAIATLVRLEQRCELPGVSGQHLAELRHLRGELGLTLAALAKLGLEIEDETPDEGTGTARVRRLRAIDPDVSA
jgi:hypothetical protein